MRSLTKADGAEMAGDLQPARMRSINGRLKFRAGNEHIGFERTRAFVGPIVNGFAGIVRPAELMELRDESCGSFKIRRSHIDLGPGCFSRINRSLDFQVGVRLDVPSGANRGHTRGEI